MKPRAVVVERDPVVRQHLSEVLAKERSIDLVAEAHDHVSGSRLLDEVRPDIALLCIESFASTEGGLPGGAGHPPFVIFTASSGRHAVTAFEVGAVDYLLKPFTAERLRVALRRAVDRLDDGAAGSDAPWAPDEDAQRLFLRERDRIVPVPVERVSRLEADGDYVVVHVGDRRHLVRTRLQDLETRLGKGFLRVHRSHLVGLDHVRLFEDRRDGRLVVVMKDATRIVASRSHSRELRRLAR